MEPRGPQKINPFIFLYISRINNLNKIIGITSSIIIMAGCLLKAFHLQGAALLLTSGFLIFSLIFMPSIIFYQLNIYCKEVIQSITERSILRYCMASSKCTFRMHFESPKSAMVRDSLSIRS